MHDHVPKRKLPLSRKSAFHGIARQQMRENRPPGSVCAHFPSYDECRNKFRGYTQQLQDHALEVTGDSLECWVDEHVVVDRDELYRWLRNPEGAVFATPHYGPFVGAALMFAQEGQDGRPSNIFYDPTESVPDNERFDQLFGRFRNKLNVLHNKPRGLIKAVRALRKGQCISIMFDVVQRHSDCLFVPFFDKLYPAMGGAAYLSLLARAPLVPAYTIPESGQRLRVVFGEAIRPVDYDDVEKEQRIFLMTCALFSGFEAQLRGMPWHWIYWDNVRHASVYDEEAISDGASLHKVLCRRIDAYPQLLTAAPSLKALLDNA